MLFFVFKFLADKAFDSDVIRARRWSHPGLTADSTCGLTRKEKKREAHALIKHTLLNENKLFSHILLHFFFVYIYIYGRP